MIVEDPRKTGLKSGLAQLTISQLKRVIEYPGEMLLDEFNYYNGKFCPLAIGAQLDKTMSEPSHNKVYDELTNLGYKVYNTRGIEGKFYTDNRKEDLLIAAHEVLEEKIKQQWDDDVAWANYMADREDEFGGI
jgi:hypothetical protein